MRTELTTGDDCEAWFLPRQATRGRADLTRGKKRMIVEPSKCVENEGSQKVQVLRERVRGKERNAEVLLRGVPDQSEGGPEEETAGFYECCGASD